MHSRKWSLMLLFLFFHIWNMHLRKRLLPQVAFLISSVNMYSRCLSTPQKKGACIAHKHPHRSFALVQRASAIAHTPGSAVYWNEVTPTGVWGRRVCTSASLSLKSMPTPAMIVTAAWGRSMKKVCILSWSVCKYVCKELSQMEVGINHP